MEKIATVSDSDSGGSSSAKYVGHKPARAATTASPKMIVSTEKIATKILRKLDMVAEREVV